MPLPVSLPDGYVEVAGPGSWGFARADAAPWASGVLGGGETLHAWAARHPERRGLMGRGRVWAVPAPDTASGEGCGWVVRHYHRGGAMAPWLRDRYLAVGVPRPVRELRACLEVARRGIPTPEVVAGAVYPGGAFYRADLVTEEIEGVDLGRILRGSATPSQAFPPEAALACARALVARLADAGVRHPDLSSGNVILQATGEGLRAWLLDLDRCGFAPGPDPAAGRAMLRRLERSVGRLRARGGS